MLERKTYAEPTGDGGVRLVVNGTPMLHIGSECVEGLARDLLAALRTHDPAAHAALIAANAADPSATPDGGAWIVRQVGPGFTFDPPLPQGLIMPLVAVLLQTARQAGLHGEAAVQAFLDAQIDNALTDAEMDEAATQTFTERYPRLAGTCSDEEANVVDSKCASTADRPECL